MFYLLNKPKGVSSFKFIKSWAREKGIKKIGHTGTLDPLASGALLVATGQDTKLIDYIDKGFKTYRATMVLGQESDTYDSEGTIIDTKPVNTSEQEVIKTLKSFIKTYDQMPPNFSAKKINGVRAYKLAREGKEVKLKANTITIQDICNINKINESTYIFDVTVSRGTYIRSLIHDIGSVLETGALMSDLIRTSIGPLVLKQDEEEVKVVDLLTIPIINIPEEYLEVLKYGKSILIDKPEGKYALIHNNLIVGICEQKDGKMSPKKVFLENFPK